MARDASIGVNLIGRDVSASKALDKVGSNADRLASKMNDVANKMFRITAAAAAAAAAVAVKIGVEAVKSASDFNETLSKTNVIFGKNADAINKFAAGAADSLGQSATQAMDAAGQFALFGKVAGFSGKQLVGFSTGMTKLAADFASFYNTSPDEAITAIGAAMRGENEPIRKFNVLIDDAAMKQELLSRKLYKGKGSLTAQQKVLAAYYLILKQSKVAQGDFARTSDGLANQQRILAANLENTKIKLGQSLLPVVTEYAQILNRDLIPKIQVWIEQHGPEMRAAFEKMVPVIEKVAGAIGNLVTWAIDNKDSLRVLAETLTAVFVAVKLYTGYKVAVRGILALAGAFTKLAAAETAVGTAAAGLSAGPIAAALTIATGGLGVLAAGIYAQSTQNMPAGKNAGGVNRELPGTVAWANKKAARDRLTPQTQSDVLNLNRGDTINVYVRGNVVDSENLLRWMNDAEMKRKARKGLL